jgi:CRP-like cAMP-binding protein
MKNLENIINIQAHSQTKNLKKGAIVQNALDLNSPAIYVKKGILRSYIIDSSGKEHIYMFASEGWIIGDIEAMEYNQPAELFIDCLENSEVFLFNKNCLYRVDLPKEQIIENVQLLSRRIARLQRRVLLLMGAPAIDRYKYFIEIYPDLSSRLSQRMIASYLGIAPQTLSTLRSKIVKST